MGYQLWNYNNDGSYSMDGGPVDTSQMTFDGMEFITDMGLNMGMFICEVSGDTCTVIDTYGSVPGEPGQIFTVGSSSFADYVAPEPTPTPSTGSGTSISDSVSAAGVSLGNDLLSIGVVVLPIAAVLVALTIGWRMARKFIKG